MKDCPACHGTGLTARYDRAEEPAVVNVLGVCLRLLGSLTDQRCRTCQGRRVVTDDVFYTLTTPRP